MAALSANLPELNAGVTAAVAAVNGAGDAGSASATGTALANLVAGEGIPTLYAVMPHIIAIAKDGNSNSQAGALEAITALTTAMGTAAEPYLLQALEAVILLGSNRDEGVRNKAADTGRALMTAACPAVSFVMPVIFRMLDNSVHWQSRVNALNLISIAVEEAPAETAACLPDIVPGLTPCMTDTKKEVKSASKDAMKKALSVAGNSDISGVLKDLVTCILKPKQVPELMHKLAGVVFVQTMEAPAMAVLVPLLVRGLREKSTTTRRQTAVIIDNMSKLVENPLDSAPFLPLLLPALEKATETVSDPEARAICERGLKQLQRLDKACKDVLGGEDGEVEAIAADQGQVLGIIQTAVGQGDAVFAVSQEYLATICCALIDGRVKEPERWAAASAPYLASFLDSAAVATGVAQITTECVKQIKEIVEEEEEDDGKEILADCEFTLAYGTKILLHNTKLKVKRGARYGLLGGNDSGKTTLMRSISQEQIEGFPPATEVRTVFVEADILGELSHLSCVDYVLADPRIQADNITGEQVAAKLRSVGWSSAQGPKENDGVDTLSGGWRMKLALTRAMLLNADILLFDEPTNHMDVMNVKWVKDWIIAQENVTSIMVSHDSGFLDDCCTHILQIANLKLHTYKGNLSQFVEKVPEARSYFELGESKLKFTFPQPGPLEGVKSKGKALMKMEGVNYRYPINDHFTIIGCTVQVSLSSRVGCVGPNGAGKSTMIKCLTGEVEPTTGTRWAHPNLRMAYVAQHAFHHIEAHLDKTPNEYIRWRYASGDDKEAMNKVTMTVSDEEQAAMDAPYVLQWKDDNDKIQTAKRFIEKLTGIRRQTKGGGKEYEYETKWKGIEVSGATFLTATKLIKAGWEKHVRAVDQKIAMMAGMYIRPLTTGNVEKHLEDVGLGREFGTHYRMGALSGGQKVKVVIGAAMWNQPHIVILDEPTNYLDRESLGALANAIIEYEGGVVIITHNDEFCRKICPERWVLQKMGDGIGRLDCQGDPEWMKHALEQKVEFKAAEEMVDASGNVTEVVQKKEMSKKEKKAKIKTLKAKIKGGDPLDTDEEAFAIENSLM
eukprot:CAMPEP_0182570326 /NCGR_PEP_ID=MMETSP1324-20130603/10671_1 /TAXON_ID=236786 /ORGANISM="Florenciella sp., Strain RCC1587" /LENGTH=1068 /DNA_ID=CAMNT_0024784705 /DNA_START=58 /DNA_END=3264 /DNA_ORIENTATION=-